MPEPHDQQLDDYDERPRGPGSATELASTKKFTMSPMRLSLMVGSVFGAILVFGVGSILMNEKIRGPRGIASRMQSSNNLKVIGLGIHNYHDTWGQLPYNSYSPAGKPLLSWRVHILPFLEEESLYNQFNLDEPWDSPNNIRLLGQIPKVYAHPADRGRGVTVTFYRGFNSPGAAFEPRPGQVAPRLVPLFGRIPDPQIGLNLPLKDGTNTLLVVEAGDPVEWTKPDDLDAAPGKPFPTVGGMGWRKVFQALMADGSVRSLRLDTPEETLRALVSHNGGEAIPPDLNQ